MKQSKLDPLPFFGEKVTCIVYVENIIFWDRNKDYIHNLAMYSRELGVDLEQEDDAPGFLGLSFEWESNTGLLEMKKTVFTWCVIEAVGLDDGIVKGGITPSEQRHLFKDTNDKPPSGIFSYSSVFGIII